MKLLALDSATQRRSVALLLGDHLIERCADGSQQEDEALLPQVQELLEQADTRLRELDAIAFCAGPGAFTGIRIGCGIAQGLAFGLDLPVVPVSSLMAIAASADRRRVVVALDARMGEIYHAAYEQRDSGWRCLAAPSVCSAERAPRPEGDGWFGAGSGFAAYGAQLRERYGTTLIGADASIEPSAAQIARLGAQAFARGESVPAHLALPVYVRDKVALTTTEQAALRSAAKA